MNQIDTMLIPYARQTALKLVYNLANNDADKFAYEEAKKRSGTRRSRLRRWARPGR